MCGKKKISEHRIPGCPKGMLRSPGPFVSGKAEAQRGDVTCPRSHSQAAAEQGLELRAHVLPAAPRSGEEDIPEQITGEEGGKGDKDPGS